MITEQQEEQAGLYALGGLPAAEQAGFEVEIRANAELRELVHGFQRVADVLAWVSPRPALPPHLKAKILERLAQEPASTAPRTTTRPEAARSGLPEGLRFVKAEETTGWKQLPIPGAWIRLLSLEPERGYAVLMGRLEPGVRYPAHINAGPEEFYILTGDLHIGGAELHAGDFHHADRGSHHDENYSVGGCMLLAVLTTDDPLVAYAMA